MDTTNENDYFELEPFDQYKPEESKFQASLKWLLSKSYGNSVPSHLNEPFFEENELGKSLRSDIVNELIDGNIYCLACKHLFTLGNSSTNNINSKYLFHDISDVFDHLERTSFEVTDENDDPVTPQVICQDSPFYASAHLALIDTLMIVYASRAMRLDSVLESIKKYTNTFDPAHEMPDSCETNCVLWLNKVMQSVLCKVECECELFSKQSTLVRCQSHLHLPKIGKSDDISQTLSTGTILAVLLVFYTCDADIDLSDITLTENVGFEESVENLNLVKEFCDKFISSKPFHFNFEDFLYSPHSMKINKIALIAELFYSLEVQPINIVLPNHFDLFKDYIKKYTKRHFHATTPFLSARISDVTRNSFIRGGSYTPQISTSVPENAENKK
jgi:calmodulin-regulated spectrin-associated protein